MGLADDCYTPKILASENSLLLSISQWQMLQLYLVDAMHLPLTPAAMPFPKVLAIYKRLYAEAVAFRGSTMPGAAAIGNKLYNYGSTAVSTFRALIRLMEAPTPDKDAILNLLENLQSQAAAYRDETGGIYQAIEDYITATRQAVQDLDAALKNETDKIGADRAQIERLQVEFQTQYADKQQAQAQIVSDRQVIGDTVYYSWLPFVGTLVAVGKIIAKQQDIKQQLQRINNNIAEMQRIQRQISELNKNIAQLTYAAQYNKHMQTKADAVMSALQPIKSAWQTIADELGDVIDDVRRTAAAKLKNLPCLAAVELSHAATAWQDVAHDAHAYMMNFYILTPRKEPVKKVT